MRGIANNLQAWCHFCWT